MIASTELPRYTVEAENPELSLTDAWELAVSRGCKLSRSSFRQWFTNHKGKKLYGISKHGSRGKYIDVGVAPAFNP